MINCCCCWYCLYVYTQCLMWNQIAHAICWYTVFIRGNIFLQKNIYIYRNLFRFSFDVGKCHRARSTYTSIRNCNQTLELPFFMNILFAPSFERRFGHENKNRTTINFLIIKTIANRFTDLNSVKVKTLFDTRCCAFSRFSLSQWRGFQFEISR